jgi:hypothetical protein
MNHRIHNSRGTLSAHSIVSTRLHSSSKARGASRSPITRASPATSRNAERARLRGELISPQQQ